MHLCYAFSICLHDIFYQASNRTDKCYLLRCRLVSIGYPAWRNNRWAMSSNVCRRAMMISQSLWEDIPGKYSRLHDHTYQGLLARAYYMCISPTFSRLSQLPVHRAIPSPDTPMQLIRLSCPDKTPIRSPFNVSQTLQL